MGRIGYFKKNWKENKEARPSSNCNVRKHRRSEGTPYERTPYEHTPYERTLGLNVYITTDKNSRKVKTNMQMESMSR